MSEQNIKSLYIMQGSGEGFTNFLTRQLPICIALALGAKYIPGLLPKNKPNEYKPAYSLLGDVGGTNIRLELVLIQPPHNAPLEVVKKDKVLVKNYATFEEALRHFLADIPIQKYPSVASIGIAGPVENNCVSMANVGKWGLLEGEKLGKSLGIKDFIFLNDFTANSYGLLLMQPDNFVSLNGLEIQPHKVRGVLGPGTGLGNSVIYAAPFRNRERIYVLASQGGHIDFGNVGELSIQYFNFFKERSGHNYISLERSFCGPSIPYMFQFFANKYPEYDDADQIPTSQEILVKYTENPNADTLYKKTVEFFLELYCNAISNFIVTHMCTGGLYLVGSLTNAVLEKLKSMDISKGYKERHPQMALTIDRVPIVFSKEVDLGLKGAYVYARRVISDEQHD